MINGEFPQFPGYTTLRQFEGYDPYQQALWEAFEDMFYARVGGYRHTRMPSPGRRFDQDAFNAWKAKAIKAWQSEATRDAKTRGITEGDMDASQWLCLYERLLDAAQFKEQPS